MSADPDLLLVIEATLPTLSTRALAHFTELNPHYNGAGWADCLEVLSDSDANLEITEPLYEALAEDMDAGVRWTISLVALTLFYAFKRPPTEGEVYEGIVAVLA